MKQKEETAKGPDSCSENFPSVPNRTFVRVFSITHFARKNKRGRKNFGSENCIKWNGDLSVRIRFPDEIFQTGDQGFQRGGNRRESRREQGGLFSFSHRGTEDVQKRLAGAEGGREKENGNGGGDRGVEEQWLAQKVKCNNNKSLFKRKSKGNTGEKQIFVV